MAPPIPGLRPPAQAVQRRTPADIALGILAVLALAILVAGVPLAIIMFVGLPVPHSLSLSVLTSQLDPVMILKILSVLVWLAWIQLVWCAIVEIRAAVRNVGVADRVPLAGGTQSLVNRLVTTAFLLFSVTTALSPAFVHPSAPAAQPAHSISVQAQVSGHESPDTARAQPAAHHQQASPTERKMYTVSPPAGRYHESLWEIAQHHLGDGRRYKEIFELNKDHVQPDGTKLTIASLIRPGWTLRMPSDAYGPGIETVSQHSQHGDGGQGAGEHRAVAADAAAQGHADAAAGLIRSQSHDQGYQTASTVVEHAITIWPAELAAASLLAAGVLSALGRRRRERLWQRAFGRRLAAPEGDAAVAEQALRLGADDPAVRLLDTSLRHLSRVSASRRKPLPTVFAARLGDDFLDLWVAPPDSDPPAPWTARDGGQVWRIHAAAAASLDPGDALAPYPGLVSLGTDNVGRVLVDLEVARGLIAVRGPGEQVRAMIAALAVELVTNGWSDRMQVTIAGLSPGLDLISPERINLTQSLDQALDVMERHAAELTSDLAEAGVDSVLTGRAAGGDPDTWVPRYLISAVPPTPEQAERLLALASTRQRTGLGFVVAGDVPGATWTWDLSADGRLRAPALGFDVAAQLLPPTQYNAVVALFRGSGREDPLVTDPATGAAPVAHLAPGASFPVEVGLLGPVSVSAAGPVEPERAVQATEIVAYLATRPRGAHLNVLTGAVWPRGVTAEVRDAALARVGAWLGTDSSGAPNLVTDSSGRLGFGPGVRVDWQVFRALIASADAAGGPGLAGGSSAEEARFLERALALVRGQALDGHEPGRYAWLPGSGFASEVTALVADVADRLSVLRLSSGDPEGAADAARSGLRLAFGDETLWRDLLRAAHATGDEQVLRSVVDEVSARVALDEVMPRLAPETEALIDELMPSWRSSAA